MRLNKLTLILAYYLTCVSFPNSERFLFIRDSRSASIRFDPRRYRYSRRYFRRMKIIHSTTSFVRRSVSENGIKNNRLTLFVKALCLKGKATRKFLDFYLKCFGKRFRSKNLDARPLTPTCGNAVDGSQRYSMFLLEHVQFLASRAYSYACCKMFREVAFRRRYFL